MYIFPMKFHAITLLFLPISPKRIEIESITLLFLLRSIALSSSITICLLLPSAGLKIGEELLEIRLLLFLFCLLLSKQPFLSAFLNPLNPLLFLLILSLVHPCRCIFVTRIHVVIVL
jgi:hypothetical protein